MPKTEMTKHEAAHRYASPWSLRERIGLLLWHFAWPLLCQWTPKPLNPWRLLSLRLFGCKIHGYPFVHQRARIQIPWNVTLHDRSCVGDRTNLYSLGEIEIGPRAVVAQEGYLCTGTHDFADQQLPLMTAKITVGADAFLGARVFVLPGVQIGEGAVVGACSLVNRDVEPWSFNAGSPSRYMHARVMRDRTDGASAARSGGPLA